MDKRKDPYTLFYNVNDELKEAQWEPLKVLYKHESDIFCENSHLTEASIQPSK